MRSFDQLDPHRGATLGQRLVDQGPLDLSDDDLPMTVRRDKARQERDAEAAAQRQAARDAQEAAKAVRNAPPQPVAVRALRIPFLALVWFFLKCALAAIPALAVLIFAAWGLTEAGSTLFPALMKFKVLIYAPAS